MKILIPIILILFLILIILSVNENFDNIGYATCLSQNMQSLELGSPTTIQTDLVNLDIFIDNVINMINTQNYNLNNLDLMNMKELVKKTMDDVNTGYKTMNFYF